MSNGLIIILIIVVWLFVLAPLLMRGQKSIRKAGEGFDDTRVIHQGGSGDLPARRRPRLTAADVRPTPATAEDEELELVDASEILFDEDLDIAEGVESERPTRFKGLFTRQTPADEETEPEVVDGGIVHELEPAQAEVEAAEDGAVVTAAVDDDWDEWDEETTYAYDDSYTSPGDMLYPDPADAAAELADEEESAAADSADSVLVDDDADLQEPEDLSDDEIEFAEHRAARGGWDPVADAANSVSRYQRRQRTLIGLSVGVVLTAVLAFIVGGWTWALAGLAALVTVVYLVALRQQVREEQALRNRRIRQLRRARLGVLNAADEELAIPRHLRHPGAVILERDDESPDFEDLPVVETRVEEPPAPTRTFRRPDIFHDDRRVG